MSTIFRTTINYAEEGPISTETAHLSPSETQPDEVMSIREMLTRHVRGLPVDGEKGPGVYYPEELGYIPDLKELDLVEMMEYHDHYAELAKKADSAIKQKEAEEADKKAKADAEAKEEKELLASLRKNSKPGEAGKPQKSDGPPE